MIFGWRAGCLALLLILWVTSCAPQSQIPPTLPIFPTINPNRPIQSLYQLEARASVTGWTADMAIAAAGQWHAVGDLPQAVSFWELALRIDQDAIDPIRQLASDYLQLQHWSAAMITLNSLLRLVPDDPWANFEMGVLRLTQNWDGARGNLEHALGDSRFAGPAGDLLGLSVAPLADSDRPLAAGTLLTRHGLWAEAEYLFAQAAALDTSSAEALASLGLARDQQGKNGADQIRQAVARDPKNPRVRYLEGLHLRAVGDSIGSLAALEMAAALHPSNPAYAAEVGMAYQMMGNVGRAEQWFRQAVALSGGAPEFQAMLDALPAFSP